jgi:hypothetical protein
MHRFQRIKIEGAQAQLLSGKFLCTILLQRIFIDEIGTKRCGDTRPHGRAIVENRSREDFENRRACGGRAVKPRLHQ